MLSALLLASKTDCKMSLSKPERGEFLVLKRKLVEDCERKAKRRTANKSGRRKCCARDAVTLTLTVPYSPFLHVQRQ